MSDRKNQYILSMIIIGALFFVFGFITWLNGILIPYLKIACQLESDLQSFLVATAFFIAYAVMAIPSSYVLRATGYKKGMAVGLLVMAVGALIFIPAAKTRDYNLFLLGLFIIGTGLALLQTASNPYVAIIGPMESAATRISIMGVGNKAAGILGGLIFGYIALDDVDAKEKSLKMMDEVARNAELTELASRVIVPYLIITAVLVLLAVTVLLSSLPDINEEENVQTTQQGKDRISIFRFPYLFLGVLALFLYVGVEVMAGDTIISYGRSLGIKMSIARYFTPLTLLFMIIGYVIGIFLIPKRLSQARALSICAILGVVFTILAVITKGFVSVAFIALLGLAHSLMWPAIFPLAIEGLGRFTKIGSAFLIMAIAGGAILPLVYGWLKELDGWTDRSAYIMMAPCYLYILYFAVKGHKVGKA